MCCALHRVQRRAQQHPCSDDLSGRGWCGRGRAEGTRRAGAGDRTGQGKAWKQPKSCARAHEDPVQRALVSRTGLIS